MWLLLLAIVLGGLIILGAFTVIQMAIDSGQWRALAQSGPRIGVCARVRPSQRSSQPSQL